MTNADHIGSLGMGIIAGIVIFSGMFMVSIGNDWHEKAWHTEALKAGHAEYIFDDDGEPVWQWKKPCTDVTR